MQVPEPRLCDLVGQRPGATPSLIRELDRAARAGTDDEREVCIYVRTQTPMQFRGVPGALAPAMPPSTPVVKVAPPAEQEPAPACQPRPLSRGRII